MRIRGTLAIPSPPPGRPCDLRRLPAAVTPVENSVEIRSFQQVSPEIRFLLEPHLKNRVLIRTLFAKIGFLLEPIYKQWSYKLK